MVINRPEANAPLLRRLKSLKLFKFVLSTYYVLQFSIQLF